MGFKAGLSEIDECHRSTLEHHAERSPTLTVGIITLNEEKRIKRCITSALFADQIVVVDAGSSDETRAIASELGAEVYTYDQWLGFAEQRNRLLQHARGDYIFFLDADEVLSPELAAEIRSAIASNGDSVWRVFWCEVVFGTPLPRIKNTSRGVLRLFKRVSLKGFSGLVHEQVQMVSSDVSELRLKARLIHHSRETIHASILKLAQYAQLGARKRRQAGKPAGVILGIVVSWIVFLRKYFLNGGVLSGKKGFVYCFLLALEVFFIYAEADIDSGHEEWISKRGE